jgi:hypothetical protein
MNIYVLIFTEEFSFKGTNYLIFLISFDSFKGLINLSKDWLSSLMLEVFSFFE